MDIKKIIKKISNRDKIPYTAIKFILQNQESVTPFLLDILDDVLKDYKNISCDRIDYILALVFFAKFKEPLAFAYIIEFLILDSDWSGVLLKNMFLDELPRMLISTYHPDQGHIDLLRNVIENKNFYTLSRISCIKAFLGLYANKYITRDYLVDFFKSILTSSLVDNNNEFTAFVVDAVFRLYLDELFMDVKNVFDNNLVDEFIIDEDLVYHEGLHDIDEHVEHFIFNLKCYQPIDDIFKSISFLYNVDRKINLEKDSMVCKLYLGDSCHCIIGKSYKNCCFKQSSFAKA